MEITTFNPLIVSSKAGELIALFEVLGFEKSHAPSIDVGYSDITFTRMTDGNGHHVDIAEVKNIPQDKTIIRMNVDNFQEAYDLLTANGFRNPMGERTIDTETRKSANLVSTSGLEFQLIQHIKKE